LQFEEQHTTEIKAKGTTKSIGVFSVKKINQLGFL
jgi:hypothetical protein